MNAGDVYWVELPTQGGHTQAGRRPAVIAQGSEASSYLPTILIIPLTSQLDALRFPGTVLVEADADNGLRRASVALVFQLTVVDKRVLGSQLGKVSTTVMDAIWRTFDEITDRAQPETQPISEDELAEEE